MFYNRIVFFSDENLHFTNLSQNPIELFQDGSRKCTCIMKKQGKFEKVIIEYGGFETAEEANEEGVNLLRNIKVDMCKQQNKINISGFLGMLDSTFPTINIGGLTEFGLSDIRKDLLIRGIITEDIRVLKDILGLAIYEVKTDLSEIHFVGEEYSFKENTDFKIQHKKYQYWCDKLDASLSLLNSSNLVNDIRLNFLLKIMSLESLVSEKEIKDDTYIKTLDNILTNIDAMEIDTTLRNMLKNDIGLLKQKSIGQKCKSLISKCCHGKKYNNLDPLKFFNNCYKIRSSFVHAGNINLDDINDNILPLRDLVIDIIEYISENYDTSDNK